MKREIKFRGYCKELHKWIFGDLVQHEIGTFILENKGFENRVRVQADTIGQYIGIDDENEIEIYEGDILRLNYKYDSYSNGCCIPDQDNFCVGYVVFDDDYSGWCVHIVESDNVRVIEVGNILPIYMFDYVSGYEVIGNIFDNPKLLEI